MLPLQCPVGSFTRIITKGAPLLQTPVPGAAPGPQGEEGQLQAPQHTALLVWVVEARITQVPTPAGPLLPL